MWLNVVHGMSSFEIADLLFMSEWSVQRYLSLFHSTGSVAPKYSTGVPGKILTEVEQFSVLQSLIYNPSAFLHKSNHSCMRVPASEFMLQQFAVLSFSTISHTRKFK